MHRNIKIRLVEGFINSILTTMLFPFMIIYFASRFGEVAAGLMMAFNALLGISSGMVGGYYSDLIGRRKILIANEIIRMCSYVGMILVNSPWCDSPVITYLLMAVNSISFGFSSPSAEAMIIDGTDSDSRKFIYSLNYWVFNLAMFVGSIAGGFLFQDYRFELFIGVLCGSFLSFFLLTFFIEEIYIPRKPENLFNNYRLVFCDGKFMLCLVAFALLIAIECQARNYVAVKLSSNMDKQEFVGMDIDGIKMFGIITAENTILVVLLGFLFSLFAKKWNGANVGVVLYSLGFAALAICTNPLMLVIVMAVVTIGELIAMPVIQATLADMTVPNQRGSYMAVNGLFMRMSFALGSISVTIGSFFDSYVMAGLFAVFGVVSLLALNFGGKK